MPGQPVVEFRTGIRDKLGYARGWLRQALQRGVRVRVVAAPDELAALSHMLWVADKESFLAHAMAGTDHARAGMSCTLIWLGSGAVAGSPPAQLLNIGAAIPDDWASFDRIVELVSRDEEDAQAGRQRWARYCQLGLQPAHRQSTPEGPEDA